MVKRALLVGCNYPGTNAALNGCIGDVVGWKAILEEFYGFDPANIQVLIDTDPTYERPTGKNIKDALKNLVSVSQDGDVLFFHFSGHGVQVPDDDPDEEADGMDEALCPCDFNMIIDDDMREIINPLDPGGWRLWGGMPCEPRPRHFVDLWGGSWPMCCAVPLTGHHGLRQREWRGFARLGSRCLRCLGGVGPAGMGFFCGSRSFRGFAAKLWGVSWGWTGRGDLRGSWYLPGRGGWRGRGKKLLESAHFAVARRSVKRIAVHVRPFKIDMSTLTTVLREMGGRI